MNKSILLFLGLVCNIMVAQDIPEAISPNGDEYNQYFDLSTLDVNKLEIYNRYGKLVYSRNNYEKGMVWTRFWEWCITNRNLFLHHYNKRQKTKNRISLHK